MNPLAGPAGPGKFSTRTDNLKMGSIAYGEGKETQEILSAQKLATTPDVKPQPVTELFAMSDETRPITSGLNRGDGPDSSALMMGKSVVKLSDTLAQMLPYDTTGEIAVLYQEALSRGN